MLSKFLGNTCNGTTCPNNAVCTALNSLSYQCVCPNQFEGDQCQFG